MPRYPEQITYWAATPDAFNGYTFAAPVTINARWQDVTEVMTDARGNTLVSSAIVYVDRDVVEQGYLYNGISQALDPTQLPDAQRIQRMDKSPNIRYSDYLRKVIL